MTNSGDAELQLQLILPELFFSAGSGNIGDFWPIDSNATIAEMVAPEVNAHSNSESGRF